MANIAHSRLTSLQTISWPGRSARSFGQMGVDPLDDLGPVAGIDHQQEERLAVAIVIVADQHVVEDSALVVGDQRIADLAQFHVGHAAGQQFGQKDGRPGPLEAQPAHVRDVGDAHGRARWPSVLR